MNAVDQSNPWGSVSYQIDPTTGRLTQNTSLNPYSQAQLNAQQMGGAYMGTLGLFGLGNAANALQQPFNVNAGPGLVSNVQGGPIQTGLGNYGSAPQTSIANNASQYQTSLAPTSLGITGSVNPGNVSGASAYKWNTSNLPNLNQDYGKQFYDVSQSVLNAQMPVLNRLQQQQQSELDAKLAGQGFTQGSAGANTEQQRLAQSQAEAYNQLAAQAYGQGLQTQGQLFNQQLGSRQQLFGEQATQAANAMQAAQLNEQASAQNAANRLAAAQFGNQAQQQQYLQGMGAAQLKNSALGQQFGQNLQAGQFGQQGQNQAFNQALQGGLFSLGAQQQQFGQGMQNAALQNQANQQGIQNQMLGRQYPIQELQGLFGFGGGAQMPQFGSVPQAGIQAPNYGGYAYQTAGLNQDAYNAQQAARGNMMSGLFGLGSGILGMF